MWKTYDFFEFLVKNKRSFESIVNVFVTFVHV